MCNNCKHARSKYRTGRPSASASCTPQAVLNNHNPSTSPRSYVSVPQEETASKAHSIILPSARLLSLQADAPCAQQLCLTASSLSHNPCFPCSCPASSGHATNSTRQTCTGLQHYCNISNTCTVRRHNKELCACFSAYMPSLQVPQNLDLAIQHTCSC